MSKQELAQIHVLPADRQRLKVLASQRGESMYDTFRAAVDMLSMTGELRQLIYDITDHEPPHTIAGDRAGKISAMLAKLTASTEPTTDVS